MPKPITSTVGNAARAQTVRPTKKLSKGEALQQIGDACKKLGLPKTLQQGLVDASGLRDPDCTWAGPQAQNVLQTLRNVERNPQVKSGERQKLMNVFVSPGKTRNAYFALAANSGFWRNLSPKQRLACLKNIHGAKTQAGAERQAGRICTLLGSTCFHTASDSGRMWALGHLTRAAASVSQSHLPSKVDIIKQAKSKLAQHLAQVKQRPYYTKANLKLARQTWKQAISTAKHVHDHWFGPVPHVVPVQTYGEFWNDTVSYPNWYEKAQKVTARLGAASQRYIKP